MTEKNIKTMLLILLGIIMTCMIILLIIIASPREAEMKQTTTAEISIDRPQTSEQSVKQAENNNDTQSYGWEDERFETNPNEQYQTEETTTEENTEIETTSESTEEER